MKNDEHHQDGKNFQSRNLGSQTIISQPDAKFSSHRISLVSSERHASQHIKNSDKNKTMSILVPEEDDIAHIQTTNHKPPLQ